MEKTILVKHLMCENGTIHAKINGQSEQAFDCDATIEIFEHIKEIPTICGMGEIKTYQGVLVIGKDVNKHIDVETIDSASFDVQADLGVELWKYRHIIFDRLAIMELNALFDWKFEILEPLMVHDLLGA